MYAVEAASLGILSALHGLDASRLASIRRADF